MQQDRMYSHLCSIGCAVFRQSFKHSNSTEDRCPGWMSLRTAMRAWNISRQEDLSTWSSSQGFPGPQLGNHISARAQEFVLSEGCRHDVRVAMLEAVYVTTTLESGRRLVPVTAPPADVPERCRAPPTHPTKQASWAELDEVELAAVFTRRVSMVRSCPHFFRRRPHNSFRTALEERYRAERDGDGQLNAHGNCLRYCP